LRRIVSEIIFAAALAVTLWFMAHLGFKPIGQALARVGPGGVLLLTLAHAPTVAALGICWWVLAGETAGAKPLNFVWGRMMRDASGDLLPFSPVGGYILGVRAVVLTGVSAVPAAVSGIVDIIVEQAAKAPYMIAAVVCLLWLAPGATLAGPMLAVLLVTVALTLAAWWRWDWVRRRLVKIAAGVSRLLPGGTAAGQLTAEAALDSVLARRRRVAVGFGLQLTAWCLGAAEAWLALHLLGASISYGEAVAIDGVYAAIRVFAFAVPAAIGVQEGSYVALCGMFGIDAPTALAFSLLRRARDVVIGAPVVLTWQFMERGRRAYGRSVERGEPPPLDARAAENR
jgi:putative membrane protein